jgi:nitrogen-specific signal transduction histidine kinase
MKTTKTGSEKTQKFIEDDFTGPLWDKSWTYIRTVVDVVREPILILDKDLRVMAANEPFYRTFDVDRTDTEKKIVYELGNGQWNIPELKKLLEDILSKDTYFKGFEVNHVFPLIGQKVMFLNARRIHINEDNELEPFPPIILLAFEDATEMIIVAKKIAEHTNHLETQLVARTKNLEINFAKLENEMNKLKKKLKT